MAAEAHQYGALELNQVGKQSTHSDVISKRTTRNFAMELDDAAYNIADLRPEQQEDDSRELAASAQHQGMESPAINASRRRRKRQSPSTRRYGGYPYDRSPSSCNRHLRRSRATASTSNNKPQALVDAEMEMELAQGSRVAEKAMRAVKQANAQVCFANLEVRPKGQASLLAPTAHKGWIPYST